VVGLIGSLILLGIANIRKQLYSETIFFLLQDQKSKDMGVFLWPKLSQWLLRFLKLSCPDSNKKSIQEDI